MPSLGKKTMLAIRAVISTTKYDIYGQPVAPLVAELDRALKPKRSVVAAKKRRAQKDESELSEWATIRELVLARAGGRCECGCLQVAPFGGLEVDHMFGRGGGRKTLQSVFTCWALHPASHHQKTNNKPSATYWLEAFIYHADWYANHMAEIGDQGAAQGYLAARDIARTKLGRAEYRAKTWGAK